ncbi:MAG TPA: inorganic diphosphatase [Actinomycetes bacterium]|jgi:inorganic pyrophosphatase|nr:inorganic diphosphatase [Actinomycetes bacterium]
MDPIIDVLIETTQGSKHKYEYDHERRAMRLDRRLYSAVTFPADYGFVAGTEGADGEPLDALVLLEDPTFPGCWVRARVVGMFWIRYDKQGQEPGTSPAPDGYDGREAALREVEAARNRAGHPTSE